MTSIGIVSVLIPSAGFLRWPDPVGRAGTIVSDLADEVLSTRGACSDEEDGQWPAVNRAMGRESPHSIRRIRNKGRSVTEWGTL